MNNRSTSSRSRLEVGSSRISTRASTHHRPADRDQLLDRDRVAGEDRVRVELQPEVLQVTGRLPMRRLPVDAAPGSWFVAQHHVLADREVGAEVHLLVDRRDACGLGVCRAAEDPWLAGDVDRAVVDGVLAGQRLDQGRLAGTVLAHQRVDLARPEHEVHLVEREDPREADRDAAHLDDRCAFGVRTHPGQPPCSREVTSAGARGGPRLRRRFCTQGAGRPARRPSSVVCVSTVGSR